MGNVIPQKKVPIIVTLPEGHRLHYLREDEDEDEEIQLAVFRVVDLYENDQYVGDGVGDMVNTVRAVNVAFKRNDDTRMLTFYATRIVRFTIECNCKAERKKAARVNALFKNVKFSYELLTDAADQSVRQDNPISKKEE